jgi:DNA-binding CsgD family transcriptional regulator
MELASLIIFIFCAAMIAGSILLMSGLLEEYPLPLLRSLFYNIIFLAAFGFYGIWGQFIIAMVAGEKLTQDVLSTVSIISLLLGLPFLVFGWMMIIRFGAECSGRRFRGYIIALFLLLNFGLIIGLGLWTMKMDFIEALPVFKYYYSAASVLFSVITALIILRPAACTARKNDRHSIAAIILASSLAQSAVLLLMPHSVWMVLTFVFLLFAGITLLPVYLTYKADLKVFRRRETSATLPDGIDEFYRQYEISPREADIISEICNGLSNQEIADRLFISLQTVKDHTSRIYSKTGVKNRMQLMTMVRTINNG